MGLGNTFYGKSKFEQQWTIGEKRVLPFINYALWGRFICISEALFLTFIKYAIWGRFIEKMVK
jgi:hypothetical protein